MNDSSARVGDVDAVPREADIDGERRAVLERLADVLIPAAEGMPAASEEGVAGEWLDRVLQARPDVRLPLLRVLDDIRARAEEPVDAIRRLQQEDAAGFNTLMLVVSGGYYMNPVVRALLGYPGQIPWPASPFERPTYIVLLEKVIQRGSIYRPTP